MYTVKGHKPVTFFLQIKFDQFDNISFIINYVYLGLCMVDITSII